MQQQKQKQAAKPAQHTVLINLSDKAAISVLTPKGTTVTVAAADFGQLRQQTRKSIAELTRLHFTGKATATDHARTRISGNAALKLNAYGTLKPTGADNFNQKLKASSLTV